ncbi:MAG: 30S ribosomal protein S17 [Pseudomonadota bacterium]
MEKRGSRKQKVGVVLSDKMNKTVIIQAERLVQHQMYKKYVRRRTRYACHDEHGECRLGDKVLITECRPLSKTKRWVVTKVLQKAE